MLSDAVSVAWLSGTLGSSPGPSLYWFDAVVELDPATSAEAHGVEGLESAEVGGVVDALLPHVPDGDYVTADELKTLFASESWEVREAYLQADGDTVVLAIVGE